MAKLAKYLGGRFNTLFARIFKKYHILSHLKILFTLQRCHLDFLLDFLAQPNVVYQFLLIYVNNNFFGLFEFDGLQIKICSILFFLRLGLQSILVFLLKRLFP